jgi:uncharacterized phage protein (TIGR02220 family)
MAKRRMISKKVFKSAKFLQLPTEAKILYTYIVLESDDEGYCDYYSTLGTLGFSDIWLTLVRHLSTNGFLEVYEEYICRDLHWLTNNRLRKDRISDTDFNVKELQLLNFEGVTDGCQVPDICQPSIGKGSRGKEEKKINKKKEVPDKKEKPPYQLIIDDLNKKTGRRFTVTKDVKDMIDKRYKDGRTLKDFYKVNSAVEFKWRDSIDPRAKDNVSPLTAYNGNFGARLLWQTKSTEVHGNTEGLKKKKKFSDIAPARMVFNGKIVSKDWLINHYKTSSKAIQKDIISLVRDWKDLSTDDQENKILELRGVMPENVKNLIEGIGR